jgi:hypothetical protein
MGDLVVFDQSKYLDTFNNFIKQLKIIFPNNVDAFTKLEEECDTNKLERGNNFVNSFNDENFNLFVKSKIKVFSHKNEVTLQISSSLFYNSEGGCCFYLKELLNNQPNQVKEIIWLNLHSLYYLVELSKSNKNESRLNMLSELLNNTPNKSLETDETFQLMNDKMNELMGDDVNEATKEMMTDMVKIFYNTINSPNKNVLGNIVEMTKIISTKYGEKMNNGEIQIDGLLKGMLSKVPGFNPALLDHFMKMTNTKSKEKVIIDENFTTAKVEVGHQEEEDNNINISNMLKIFNMFTSKGNNGMPSLSDLKDMFKGLQNDGSLPDLDKLTDMVKKMQEDGQIPNTDQMKEFAMKFQDNGTVPNMDYFMSMVSELQENPSMDKMFEMVEKMQQENMIPDMSSVLTKLQENPVVPDMEQLLKLTEK